MLRMPCRAHWLANAGGMMPAFISIVAQAASGCDLILIGATQASYVDRKLFGNVPQSVAADAPVPTVIVQRRASGVQTLLRRAEWRIAQIEDTLTTTEHAETYQKVRDGARAQPDFYVLITLAAAIATLGLLLDSAAVIIGAMVIAPLMSSILGISRRTVQYRMRQWGLSSGREDRVSSPSSVTFQAPVESTSLQQTSIKSVPKCGAPGESYPWRSRLSRSNPK